jgi:hypothetical protein
VYTTTAIVPGRKSREYQHQKFGLFTFSPLAINPGCFLDLVQRQQIDKQVFLLASPVRAFMDLVCLKKVEWQGMSWIEESMRIDAEVWKGVTSAELRELKDVYQHKRVRHFIQKLEIALGLELAVKGE